MAVIIRKTAHGKRAFHIQSEELDKLISEGKVKKINTVLHEETDEPELAYSTKMMTSASSNKRSKVQGESK